MSTTTVSPPEQDRKRAVQVVRRFKNMKWGWHEHDKTLVGVIAAALQAERERTWQRALQIVRTATSDSNLIGERGTIELCMEAEAAPQPQGKDK